MWQFERQREDHRGEKPITFLFISQGAYGPDLVCSWVWWPGRQMGTDDAAPPPPFQASFPKGALVVSMHIWQPPWTLWPEISIAFLWNSMDVSEGNEKERWDKLLDEQLWVTDWVWPLWTEDGGSSQAFMSHTVKWNGYRSSTEKMAGSLGTEITERFLFLDIAGHPCGSQNQGWSTLSMCPVSELSQSSCRTNQLSLPFSLFLFHWLK